IIIAVLDFETLFLALDVFVVKLPKLSGEEFILDCAIVVTRNATFARTSEKYFKQPLGFFLTKVEGASEAFEGEFVKRFAGRNSLGIFFAQIFEIAGRIIEAIVR